MAPARCAASCARRIRILNSRGAVIAAVEGLKQAGITDIAFYNYGHLRSASIGVDRRGAAFPGGRTVSFAGKVVAITGANGGIGRVLCRYFGEAGATIAAFDKKDQVMSFAGELGKEGIKVEAAVLDVADADAVAAAFTKSAASLGPVDILVNNVGFSGVPTLSVTSPADWSRLVKGNLDGAYYCAHAVLPAMKSRGRRRHHQHRLGKRVVCIWRSRL